MSVKIAVAGKGGTGKTTISSLIIKYLVSQQGGAVLAVDADPNSTLASTLGFSVDKSVGQMREETMKEMANLPSSLTKDVYIEMKLNQILFESKGLDLLVMGRPEGPGCYCFTNNLLRIFLEKLTGSYDYVVIDNEAGMEHLSRRTNHDVDVLIMISNYSIIGVKTVGKLSELVSELNLAVKKTYLIVNDTPDVIDQRIMHEIENQRVEFLGAITHDENIVEYALQEKGVLELLPESKSYKEVSIFMDKLLSTLTKK